MRLLRLPGVHPPLSDTALLRDAMLREPLEGGAVADLCAGTGALAIAAARAGAERVVAVDVSRRATLAAAVNARLQRCAIEVRRGDMLDAIEGERFDVIVSNPPYVPAATDVLPRHRRATALDAGRDGRALIDRIARQAPARLAPGGRLLLVQSSVCGIEQTCEALASAGLVEVEPVARERGPLGPVLARRAAMLRERGLLGAEDEEEIAVLCGRAPAPVTAAGG